MDFKDSLPKPNTKEIITNSIDIHRVALNDDYRS